jgi:RHS repeat-associated protein
MNIKSPTSRKTREKWGTPEFPFSDILPHLDWRCGPPVHADWLGSPRLVSGLSGHTAYLDQAYTPYGEIYSTFGTSQAYFNNFAGTTSNFYNGAVYDTPNRELSFIGRWLSPDPAGAGWNQYAYSTNPNSFVDPSGLYSCIVGSTGSQGCGSDNSYDESLNDIPVGYGDPLDYMTWLNRNGCNCITERQDDTYFLGKYEDPGWNIRPYTGTYEPPGWNGGQQAQDTTQTETQNPNQPVLLAQNRTPAKGDPDTTDTLPAQGGSTDRTYGPDGRAVKDVDSGHAHDPEPHAHDWDWSKNPPRQPRRPLTPDEAAGKKQESTMMDKMKSITPAPIVKMGAAGVIIYIIIDEGSRLYPPRNLVPVP